MTNEKDKAAFMAHLEFKVGDVVQVICDPEFYGNPRGVIVATDFSNMPYKVDIGGDTLWFYEKDLTTPPPSLSN